ncbi:hypothetical protein RZS08_40690, partial [Arthrospira platensis SPKY1]|nr:hypothetical protein [Arthrospira platensis SPKY1]
ERLEDLPELAHGLLQRLAQRNGEPQVPVLTADALHKLGSHDFPGNVRELENILERAMALYPEALLDADAMVLPRLEATAADFSESGFARTVAGELHDEQPVAK